MMEPLEESRFSAVLVDLNCGPPLADLTTGWSFEGSGIGGGSCDVTGRRTEAGLCCSCYLLRKGQVPPGLLGACLLVGVQVCSWYAGFSQTVLAW